MTNVKHVIVLPPTKSRMLPKLGTLSPIKSKIPMLKVLNAHLFQLNSEKLMVLSYPCWSFFTVSE